MAEISHSASGPLAKGLEFLFSLLLNQCWYIQDFPSNVSTWKLNHHFVCMCWRCVTTTTFHFSPRRLSGGIKRTSLQQRQSRRRRWRSIVRREGTRKARREPPCHGHVGRRGWRSANENVDSQLMKKYLHCSILDIQSRFWDRYWARLGFNERHLRRLSNPLHLGRPGHGPRVNIPPSAPITLARLWVTWHAGVFCWFSEHAV